MDADSFCIGSLDKIIKSDKELIGVRNNNFFGKAGSAQPCVSPFYQPWPMIRNEQDTWNHIFHAKDKYTSEIIDQEGSGVTYGVVNQWGEKDHCESWEKLYIKDNSVYIDHPVTGDPLRTSVLHAAGVSTMDVVKNYGDQYQWLYGIIDTEVSDYIQSIIGD